MADSSTISFLPLCETISYKNSFRRVIYLTVLGLFVSLLLHRILHMNENDTVWLVAFLCESCFAFVCLIITSLKWTPVETKPYPERLDERFHDLPPVDIFVPTADPVQEPPILVINTVLSLLAVNYPANKLACYVSDDGCSPLTYFSLKEASKFAKIWVPFCKKYNVRVRAPFRYFLNPLDTTEGSEFSQNWQVVKREYEKLCRKVEDATGDSHWLEGDSDFKVFSSTKRNDHSTIVKVVWENKEGVGEENEVPHIVYISREKRPNYFHHHKSGAMNFLARVSGLMTNAPYILCMDCDMYANEANVLRQAMCVFLQKSINSNHRAFVQFPQDFYDSNNDLIKVLQTYMVQGIAGIQGPIYLGTGCVHTRRVMYGLSTDDLEDDGSLSSYATREFLAEDNLEKRFGNSKEMMKSVADALQRKSNPKVNFQNSIEMAREVGHCQYEYHTSWGITFGWLYDSVAEDVNTSIGIHSRGWTSSHISPDPPAFLGSTPQKGHDLLIQQRRWATGWLEVLFNKHSPLRGMFSRKLRFQQRLAYLGFCICLRSIPELLYCLLPAYCLLHNSALFPKGLYLSITITIIGIHCLYTLWEFMSLGYSVESWCESQSLWRIIATSSWLFSIFDITLKLLGISKRVFIIAQKSLPDTRSGLSQSKYDGPISENFEVDGSIYFLPGTFIVLVNLAALAMFTLGLLQQSGSSSSGGHGSGLAEACGCVLVVLLFLPFLKALFKKGKYGIPVSTICKASFVSVLFVVFSLGK